MSPRAVAVVLCLAVLGLLVPGAAAESLDREEPDVLLDRLLPLEDLDGRSWQQEDLAGRVVLIDFWATWCPPCLAELPHMKRAYRRYAADGFEILAVSVDQTERRTLRRWLRVHRVPWPQLYDGRGLEGELAVRLDVGEVPRSFLFDRSGRLVATDLRGEALEAAVAALSQGG